MIYLPAFWVNNFYLPFIKGALVKRKGLHFSAKNIDWHIMVDADDLKLINGLCNKEEWAAREILRRIRLSLKRWRWRLDDRANDAENISYIKLFEYVTKPDFVLKKNLNALIKTIVNHICLDMVRGKPISIEKTMQETELPDDMANPEELQEIKERAEIIRDMIRLLDKKCQRLFILHFGERKAYEEIAILMNTTESAIKQLMTRCKKKAKKILKKYFGIDRLF
jgi:RNA polymerase sigma factor (sigma-70 family)